MNQRSAEYLDLGANGVSPGDFRIGRVVLVDETGNEAGIMRWVTRSLDAAPAAGETSNSLGNYIMLLDDGQIHFQSLAETVRPADNVDTPSVGNITGVIFGGTGAYRLARGNVEVSAEEGVTFVIDIRCD